VRILGIRAYFIICLIFVLSNLTLAEEVVRGQAIPQTQVVPKVQAANLAPMETKVQPSVIELKPQAEIPIRVQSIPRVINQPQTVSQPVQIQSTPKPQPINPPSSGQSAVAPPKQVPQNSGNLITPVSINQEMCSKMFAINAESLFLYTLGAIEANNFEIMEIQSKGGFITFRAMDREFLATVAVIDNKTAMLRINPTNGVYHFAPGIVSKIFEYVNFKYGES